MEVPETDHSHPPIQECKLETMSHLRKDSVISAAIGLEECGDGVTHHIPLSVHVYVLSKPYGSWFWMMVGPHSSSLVMIPVMASGQGYGYLYKIISIYPLAFAMQVSVNKCFFFQSTVGVSKSLCLYMAGTALS